MRRRLLVDVDEVVGDFLTPTLTAIAKVTGTITFRADQTEWNIFASLTPSDREAVFSGFIDQPGFAREMPVHEEAAYMINLLSEYVDIQFVTSPWRRSKTWVYDRNQWLEEHFPLGVGKRVCHTAEKECVVGDFLIDDKPDNVVRWKKAHPRGQAILLKKPYNAGFESSLPILHTDDWDFIEDVCRY